MIDAPVLWRPDTFQTDRSALAQWSAELLAAGLIPGDSYHDLWAWSVAEPAAFWHAWARQVGVAGEEDAPALGSSAMPGAKWFPGTTLNYADHALAQRGQLDALAFNAEDVAGTFSRDELYDMVRRAAGGLRSMGVVSGDCVAAYVSNRWEAVVGFLATASLGAIWTSCSTDFGATSVIDRVGQVRPRVLIAATGYRFGGRWHDRRDVVAELRTKLPDLKAVVLLDDAVLQETAGARQLTWSVLLSTTAELPDPVQVPFDHPLWVVYTSGTTGIPKSIVHSHGGIILEHTKLLALHLDIGPDDRFTWFTTTGWVMWNILVGALLVGAVPVLVDGNPTWPGPERMWQVAADTRTTALGLSAGFVHQAIRDKHQPHRDRDLSALRTIGITGSPLSPAGYEWIYHEVGPNTFLASISGGTDVATAFLGSVPTLPVRAGQLQHACLGVAADCWDPAGRSITGEVGELVVTQPMPSMPVGFWDDPEQRRYTASYFETYPGVWRHGDWVVKTDEGQWIVMGRSDATLNRGGVRMGSAEFYQVLDGLDWISDSLIIDTTALDSPNGELLLLVVMVPGEELGRRHQDTVSALRTQLSPRHVPDEIIAVKSLPHTLNGKRLEVPVKRLFLGASKDDVADANSLDQAASLDAVAALATAWRGRRAPTRRERGCGGASTLR